MTALLASAALAAARSTPALSADEELGLARRALAGDRGAFDRLLRSHFRLVLAIASRFRVFGGAHEELVGEGLVGLVEAGRRFDPERGVRFAVYAAQWIQAYIRRYTLTAQRLVRLPSTRQGRMLLAHLRQTERRLSAELGRAATHEELARALGVTVADVEEIVNALRAR